MKPITEVKMARGAVSLLTILLLSAGCGLLEGDPPDYEPLEGPLTLNIAPGWRNDPDYQRDPELWVISTTIHECATAISLTSSYWQGVLAIRVNGTYAVETDCSPWPRGYALATVQLASWRSNLRWIRVLRDHEMDVYRVRTEENTIYLSPMRTTFTEPWDTVSDLWHEPLTSGN